MAILNVNDGVEEQIDVFQHSHVLESSRTSQKMDKMMGDLILLFKSSHHLTISRYSSQDHPIFGTHGGTQCE
jgi:hypothetical protein